MRRPPALVPFVLVAFAENVRMAVEQAAVELRRRRRLDELS